MSMVFEFAIFCFANLIFHSFFVDGLTPNVREFYYLIWKQFIPSDICVYCFPVNLRESLNLINELNRSFDRVTHARDATGELCFGISSTVYTATAGPHVCTSLAILRKLNVFILFGRRVRTARRQMTGISTISENNEIFVSYSDWRIKPYRVASYAPHMEDYIRLSRKLMHSI